MVAPLVAAAGISAAGSLLGGLFGSSGAKKAAKIQQQTSREQIAAAEANRDYQYDLNAPTISQGDRAGELFSGFLGAGGGTDWGAYAAANPDIVAEFQNNVLPTGAFDSLDDYAKYHYENYGRAEGRALPTTSGDGGSAAALESFRGSTGYQDLVKEGLSAVNANAYAKGLGRSGATYKALQDRGTSLADRSAQGWLGNLGTLMNLGGQARGLVANVGTNTVGSTNASSQNAADASSNSALVSGQNWAQALQGIGLAASQAYGSSYGGGGGGGTTGQTPPYYPGYGLNPGYG
jgi:hypothetical protein